MLWGFARNDLKTREVGAKLIAVFHNRTSNNHNIYYFFKITYKMSRVTFFCILLAIILPFLLFKLSVRSAVIDDDNHIFSLSFNGSFDYRVVKPTIALQRLLFPVYWQVPTFQCRSHGILFEKEVSKWPGLVINENDAWRGESSGIMYDPGDFPALLIKVNGTPGEYYWRNGGLPQLGSISEHLRQLDKHLAEQVPNVHYSGVLVVDFESWRPIFRQNFGSLVPYKTLSIKLEKDLHPLWTSERCEAEAKRKFESSGVIFVKETIERVKQLRPLAEVGYYAYPYCWNTQSAASGGDGRCSKQVELENDSIDWLWKEVDLLLPSLYVGIKEFPTQEARRKMYAGRVLEAARLRKSISKQRILPYWWFRWRDAEFLPQDEVLAFLEEVKAAGADGTILWGSSSDVSSKAKCEKLLNWVHDVLGPTIGNFTERLGRERV